MRTIEKILGDEYLSNREIEFYKLTGIINGCGSGKWNFETVLDTIENFKEYKKSKYPELIKDIKQICYSHDLSYNRQEGFYKSNFLFAYRLARLINFTGFFERLLIFIMAFGLLNKYGKEFYKSQK